MLAAQVARRMGVSQLTRAFVHTCVRPYGRSAFAIRS